MQITEPQRTHCNQLTLLKTKATFHGDLSRCGRELGTQGHLFPHSARFAPNAGWFSQSRAPGQQNTHFIFVHNHNSLDSQPRNLNSGTCTRLTSPHHSCIISVIFPSSQARFSPMSTLCFMGRGGSSCNGRKQECHVCVRALSGRRKTGI